MKPFIAPVLSYILCSLALSSLVGFLRLPSASLTDGAFLLRCSLTSNRTGTLQLYYDDGTGLSEARSSTAPIRTAEKKQEISFSLPPGRLQAVRFDPMASGGEIVIHSAQIVDGLGRVQHTFAQEDFVAANQIETIKPSLGGVLVRSAADANDPSLWLTLNEPVELKVRTRDLFLRWMRSSLVPFFVLMAAYFGRARIARFAQRVSALAVIRPRVILLCVAITASVVSSYPVVFFGKSFVSPNYGTQLLYDSFPTLPGSNAEEKAADVGSDLGAIIWQHIPGAFLHADALKSGRWPFWNRYNATGSTILGQGQSMFGDPLEFLTIGLGANAAAWDLKFVLSKVLLAFALGLLAYRASKNVFISGLLGGSCVFIGFFLFRINHPAIFSFCYAPWILVGWIALTDSRDRWSAVKSSLLLVAANYMVLASGTAKEGYVLLGTLNLVGMLTVVCAPVSIRRRASTLAIGGLGCFAAMLITAPLWLTFFDTLRMSLTTYDRPSAFQIHPSFLLGLFDEIFYRPIRVSNGVANPSANFVFLVGLLLATLSWRRCLADRLQVPLAIAAAFAFCFAFGVVPPQVIEVIPILGNVAHIDNCFSLLLIILICPLAAFGFRHAVTRVRSVSGNHDVWLLAALILVLVVPWIATTQTVHKDAHLGPTVFTIMQSGHRLPVSLFVWLSLVVLSASAIVGFSTFRCVLVAGVIKPHQVVIILSCLTAMLWRHGQHLHAPFPLYFNLPPSRADFFGHSAAVAAVKEDRKEPYRVIGVGPNMNAGWTVAYRLEGVSGPEALINPNYYRLMWASGMMTVDWRPLHSATELMKLRKQCDFLGIKYYFDDRDAPDLFGPTLTPVARADLNVYRSETAWPRAFFVRGMQPYEGVSDFTRLVSDGSGAPFAAMQTTDLDTSWEDLRRPPEEQVPLAATEYVTTDNRIDFTLKADGPGVAVLQEAWLPRGFTAKVNDQPTAIVRMNQAFKAIRIPAAGTWRVSFSFRPVYFTLSLWLSTTGFIVLISLIVWGQRRERSTPLNAKT